MIWVYPHDLGPLHMLKWDSLGRQRQIGPEIISFEVMIFTSFEHAIFEPGGSLNPRMSTRKS